MKKRILVIDDTPVIRDFLYEVLTDEGFEVHAVDNGITGYEMVKSNDYIVVLCDVHMPVLNGLQTVKKIKQLKPDLPVVMTDSYPGKLAQEAFDAGALKCMAKPFSLDELRETIDKIMQKKETPIK